MIVILDYGMGNVGSIQNMLKKVGSESIVSSKPSDILAARGIILPGVGAFDTGIENLKRNNILEPLSDAVLKKRTPLLGICLGMQLITRKSEEGQLPGLGYVQADTKKFSFSGENKKLKIPHMGWNTIEVYKDTPLFKGLENDSRFYFVHSYHVVCDNKEDEVTQTEYGYNFCSALQHNTIYGVQFHPEKSHRYGMQLLKNYTLMLK